MEIGTMMVDGKPFVYPRRGKGEIRTEIELMSNNKRGALLLNEKELELALNTYDDLYFCDSDRDDEPLRIFILSDKEEDITLYQSLIKESKQRFNTFTYAFGMISGYPPLVCEWFATKRYSAKVGEELLVFNGNTMTFVMPKELKVYAVKWMHEKHNGLIGSVNIFVNRLSPRN